MSLLEKLSHSAVLVVAVIAGGLLIHDHIGPQANVAASKQTSPLVGTQLKLSGVSWSAHEQNVVLAISTQCHFCTSSTTFYKSLADRIAKHSSDTLITVLPQDQKTATAFLANHQINAGRVVSLDLSEMGVSGTPTLLIVNKSGLVTQSWVGKLPPTVEQQVMSML